MMRLEMVALSLDGILPFLEFTEPGPQLTTVFMLIIPISASRHEEILPAAQRSYEEVNFDDERRLLRRNFRNIKTVMLDTLERGRVQRRFLFTTDGFEVYEWAAKRLLVGVCIYGQVIKKRRENRVVHASVRENSKVQDTNKFQVTSTKFQTIWSNSGFSAAPQSLSIRTLASIPRWSQRSSAWNLGFVCTLYHCCPVNLRGRAESLM